jgi:hypothetical protein
VSDWKYVWRKDHGYFTFAEVVCATWFEDDEDTSSGGVHTCTSVILNCPAQGLCMSFTKAFTALILFLQTFPVTFPHLLHWIAIVLDVLYLLLGSLVPLFHRLAFLIRRWFALDWEAQQSGYHVRHQGNHKEKVIGRRRLPVVGYVKERLRALASYPKIFLQAFDSS